MSRQRRLVYGISVSLLVAIAVGGAILVYGVLALTQETVAPAAPTPAYVRMVTSLPEVSAAAWTVYDVESGEFLYSKSAEVVLPVASITKLPAAGVLLAGADLAATTTVVWGDVIAEGRAGKLQAGDVYSTRELLFPLLLESSNDAASTLGRTEPTLVTKMNQLANDLSLVNTAFADPSGLSDQNVSTARELALLSRHLYQREPHLFDMTTLSAYYSADNGWLNNSPFIEALGYQGGKHGFTPAANRTATAIFSESISGTRRELGYVLLGSDNLEKDMQALRAFVATNTRYQ